MPSEISQRKTNSVWSHLYMDYKTKNKNSHRKRDHTCGYQKWGGGMWYGIGERWSQDTN